MKALETGKRKLTVEKFRAIKAKFGYQIENSDNPLRMTIDYLRITFKSIRNLDEFVRDFLFVGLKEFQGFQTGLLNYNQLLRRGDIWLFNYANAKEMNNYQLTLQLSGAGCRQMELIFKNVGCDWRLFLSRLSERYSDMSVTRLDIALDELYQGYDKQANHFHLEDLIAKVYQKQVNFDRLKVWNHIGGGNLSFDDVDSANNQGISLYFGSRKSMMYFNFYEKRYELAKKDNISVEEALETYQIYNRYEIRLAQAKAQEMVNQFILGADLGDMARGLINREMQVYDGVGAYGAYIPDSKWQNLFGSAEPLKLTVIPEPYSIRRTIRWLHYQVSNSLAFVKEAEKIMNEQYLDDILNSGEITERMAKELEFLKSNYRND